jgi:hypothetical protein
MEAEEAVERGHLDAVLFEVEGLGVSGACAGQEQKGEEDRGEACELARKHGANMLAWVGGGAQGQREAVSERLLAESG